MSAEEAWACEHFEEPEIVLNRIQPDIAIHCDISNFHTLSRFSKDIVHIIDLSAPVQFEHLLLTSSDPEQEMRDGRLLEGECRDLVEKLRSADYLMTVSERQRYFWSAYCTMAGFSFNDLDVMVCPAAFPVPQTIRKPASNLTVVYAGGFYPSQNPDRFLRAAAAILDGIEGATLHVFGSAYPGMPNETHVNRMLLELRQHRCVRYHGDRPIEEVIGTLATAWCALELMEQNVERELAVTGRTLEFLACGTPVIYNKYATLSKMIEQYDAGWTLPTYDTSALERVLKQISAGGLAEVERISANAIRLAECELAPIECMRPLRDLCAVPVRKRARVAAPRPGVARGEKSLGRVLAITGDIKALRELRVRNPLRALHSQQLIHSYTVTGLHFEELKSDTDFYEAILIQRVAPEFVYETLHNLALPFALDTDDNVLARAAYRNAYAEIDLITGLRYCSILTAPNPRLIRGLEKYSGLRLMHKVFLTPNGLPFPEVSRGSARQPSQMLWIQSDMAALTSSREAVVQAVDDFSRRYGLPIILIGANVLKRPQFQNQVVMGEMDFTANLHLLKFAPMSIGVAPLETITDEETLDFVAGKSDLKMLLFAGYGHGGVYSAAPPYSDSPLQEGLSVVDNSYEAWTAALEYQYCEAWKAIPAVAARFYSERHIDVIARECWMPALQACVLPKPVRGMDLYEAFQAARQMDRTPARSIAYMMANWDVAKNYVTSGNQTAWAHFIKYGRHEQRYGKSTLEVHKKFLERVEKETAECLTRFEESIERRDTVIRSLNKQNEGLSNETNQLRSEADNLKYKLSALEGELSRAHTTLTGMINSRSWKWTWPLRKLTELLR